jgi:hypothetical protein
MLAPDIAVSTDIVPNKFPKVLGYYLIFLFPLLLFSHSCLANERLADVLQLKLKLYYKKI